MEMMLSGIQPLCVTVLLSLLTQVSSLLASIGPPSPTVFLELIFGVIFALYMYGRTTTVTYTRQVATERKPQRQPVTSGERRRR